MSYLIIFLMLWVYEWVRICWKKGLKHFIVGGFIGVLHPLMYMTFTWFIFSSVMLFILFFNLCNTLNMQFPDAVYTWLGYTSSCAIIFGGIVLIWVRYRISKDLENWLNKPEVVK